MKKNIICTALIILLAATAIHAQDSWTKKNPSTEPDFRTMSELATVSPDKILLFGGFAFEFGGDQWDRNDTWIYTISTNTWQLKTPSYAPTGHYLESRYLHAMADIGEDKVLLYGGWNLMDGFLSDTWIYDQSDDTWTEMSPSTSPGMRLGSAMAYTGNGKVVLFGGSADNVTTMNDTWIYDLATNSWTQMYPTTSPGGRGNHAMCNISGDMALLSNGWSMAGSGYPYADTWVYDRSDNNWVEKSPASGPGAGQRHRMASLGGDKALWFNGATWIYDLSENTWCQSTATTAFFTWGEPGITNAGNGKVLIFGGTPIPSQTWLFTGGSPCSLGSSGCISGNTQKVMICHHTNSATNPWVSICVDANAVPAHLAHGDNIEPCFGPLTKPVELTIEENPIQGFNVYPNPGYGDFMVTMNLTDENAGARTIRVINSNGQTIKIINTSEQYKLKVNIKEPGIYYIQLVTDNQVLTKKILVF